MEIKVPKTTSLYPRMSVRILLFTKNIYKKNYSQKKIMCTKHPTTYKTHTTTYEKTTEGYEANFLLELGNKVIFYYFLFQ